VANPGRSANKQLVIRNRQRAQPIRTQALRQIIRTLLLELLALDSFELTFVIVNEREMTWLNETFLRHRGSTDVLAFNYTEHDPGAKLCGEVIICAQEARAQSARFRTTWQTELVRCLVHGVLHLLGYDDRRSAARRKMKLQENRLLTQLRRRFRFSSLANGRKHEGKKHEVGNDS
jgi:probable rRNA maturation factor